MYKIKFEKLIEYQIYMFLHNIFYSTFNSNIARRESKLKCAAILCSYPLGMFFHKNHPNI